MENFQKVGKIPKSWKFYKKVGSYKNCRKYAKLLNVEK